MISLDAVSYSDRRDALAASLMKELAQALPSVACVREVAEAVATLCSQYYSEKALSSEHLTLLVSRALMAAGEEQAAEQWICDRVADEKRSQQLWVGVKEAAHFPMFASGLSGKVFRSGEWQSGGEGPSWVLDLSRIQIKKTDALEIAYFQALQTVLDGLIDVWNASSGRGGLILQGLDSSCERLILVPKERKYFSEEVRRFISDFLAREQVARRWNYSPRLIVS